MKAAYYEAFGGEEVLTIGDRPKPDITTDEVLIKVEAAAVNPIDWKIRDGLFECIFDYEFPIIPGWDAAGTIAEIGADVTGFEIGDRVFTYCRRAIAHHGACADYLPMTASAVAKVPDGLDMVTAASLPLVSLTAWQTMVAAGVKAGDLVLIHAGAGGVGSLAIPIAKHLGATVATTAGPKNHDYVREIGADEVIDYTAGDWRNKARVLAADGFDMILDGVGGSTANNSIAHVRAGGSLVCLNEPADDEKAAERGITTIRLYAEPNGDQLTQIGALVVEGKIPVPPITTMALDDIAEAHRQSKAGHVRGKLVLTVGA